MLTLSINQNVYTFCMSLRGFLCSNVISSLVTYIRMTQCGEFTARSNCFDFCRHDKCPTVNLYWFTLVIIRLQLARNAKLKILLFCCFESVECLCFCVGDSKQANIQGRVRSPSGSFTEIHRIRGFWNTFWQFLFGILLTLSPFSKFFNFRQDTNRISKCHCNSCQNSLERVVNIKKPFR